MIRLPLTDLPSYNMNVVIDGRVYVLGFTWNALYEFWTMDIALDNGDVVLSGCRLVTGFGLLEPFSDSRLPDGDFLVVNDDATQEPGRFSFSQDAALLYLSRAEINAAEAIAQRAQG